MIYGVKKIARYLLGTDIAGRQLAVRPDDTFIVSYPRSGNTWTRFLLANLLYPGEQVSFANIERLVPDAEAQSSRYLKRLPGPRFIKSHQYFDHRFPKVIYVVRDPRDVAVSYYHFSRKSRHVADGFPLDQFVDDFVAGRMTSSPWGTWGENVGTWLGARLGSPAFLLVRYEDLIDRTQEELGRVADFLQLRVTPQTLADSVQRSSAGQMREMEQQQSREWVTTRQQRPDIPFVGGAASGAWKAQLSRRAVEQIETAWGALMARLEYKPAALQARSNLIARKEAAAR
jgi:Sulfotransferase domain